MAMRSFSITLPDHTVSYRLYTLMLAQTGAIPVDGVLYDRGVYLKIEANAANGAGTVTVQDSQGNGGKILSGGDNFDIHAGFNSICFRDYYLQGSADNLTFNVQTETR